MCTKSAESAGGVAPKGGERGRAERGIGAS